MQLASVLVFGTTDVGVSGGCNSMSGTFTVENSKLVVPSLISTEMACDEPLMTFDSGSAAFLTASPSIVIAGDVMTLADDAITMTFREDVPVVDSPLEGTTWTVTGTIQGDATQSLDTEPATIVMNDGTAEVFAGCNSGSVSYTVEGATITWGDLALTRMACAEPATTGDGGHCHAHGHHRVRHRGHGSRRSSRAPTG